MSGKTGARAEELRLEEDAARRRNWKRWGPYLSERQWGTVREDYSEHGTAWDYFPHDHARSRPTAGERMGCSGSRTGKGASVSRSPSGTAAIRS